MAVVIRHGSKYCYLCDTNVARNNYERHVEEHVDEWEKVTFSNNIKDICKTKCKLCGKPFSFPALRVHTKSAHKITITENKEKFNQHFYNIIEKVFHKCGICGKPVLFDSDTIAVHLKNGDNHSITHKVYNETFLTKISGTKQEKEVDLLKLLKSPQNVKPNISKTKVARIVEEVDEKIKTIAFLTNNEQETFSNIIDPIEYKDLPAKEHEVTI